MIKYLDWLFNGPNLMDRAALQITLVFCVILLIVAIIVLAAIYVPMAILIKFFYTTVIVVVLIIIRAFYLSFKEYQKS